MRFFRNTAFLAAVFLGACSAGNQNDCSSDSITVSEAWARPGQNMSAAYLRICNGADSPDKLVSASFNGADAVELHTTTLDEEGVARMAPMTDGLELPTGSEVVMEPGGAHIMFIGLTSAIEEGDEPVLSLKFENAPPVEIALEVRQSDSASHSSH
ncbi:copper chaperone PCu(A)C [Hyphococcus flavus]|uniref:Copper chaperone PCu(A)C n=1 Tax=Hyphococcus flavus TaxID=1866326 RepID=A0AAE9ZBL9_9PROT|nr:copper chaperone PCu(A)C [Hyphococcus flavus]WDI31658.1 copper chaperone PCu(A)C [Hyphococcus flavus]